MDLALGDLYDAGLRPFARSLGPHRQSDRRADRRRCGGVFTVERVFAEDEEAFIRGVNELAAQLQALEFRVDRLREPSSALRPAAVRQDDPRGFLRRRRRAGLRRPSRPLADRRRFARPAASRRRARAENLARAQLRPDEEVRGKRSAAPQRRDIEAVHIMVVRG